ncbi:hypothetical protein V8C35DRAFT_328538 [Trichoderma chlorosporum]
MTQRNYVIAIIIIVLFVVLAAISFGIYKLVHGARRELTITTESINWTLLTTNASSLVNTEPPHRQHTTPQNTLNHCSVTYHKNASTNTTLASPLSSVSFICLDIPNFCSPQTSASLTYTFTKMADASSASKTHGHAQGPFDNSTPPSTSSSRSSTVFQGTPNEVPREYLMASSSSLPFAGQGFPFPPQQLASDVPVNPVSGFTYPQEYYKTHFQEEYDSQASHTDKDTPSSSSNFPEFDQHSSSAHLLHEQRLSTRLNILRHIQRTLRQRHEDATLQLARIKRLALQTIWDLFSQSPLDFMCHEMDIIPDAATSTILSRGSHVPQRNSVRDSEDWMRKLDGLRDLRDDEHDAEERVRKILRQMQCADAIMGVGLSEQAAVLERGNPMAGQYHKSFDCDQRQAEAVASPKGQASASLSTFFNWPLPATSPNGDGVPLNNKDDESDAASGSSEQCLSECCRDPW